MTLTVVAIQNNLTIHYKLH